MLALLAACTPEKSAAEKRAEEDRAIAQVNSAQQIKPPPTPITPQPILPVSVIIGGQPAPVSFYGEAPNFVAGVMQVNVRIPVNALTGDIPVEVMAVSRQATPPPGW